MSGRLTEGFREIIELRWSEFVRLEKSVDATNFDAVIASVARACMKSNLRAIQTALDRIDGKIATEIETEFPKFYTLYPYATMTAEDKSIIEYGEDGVIKNENGVMTIPASDAIVAISGAPADMEELQATEEELPTGTLRAVLEKMLHSPKSIVGNILDSAKAVDEGDYTRGDPMVKSVVVAGLMKLVHDGKMNAVFEVFDQIDGKVAEKFKVLGDDVYMTRYDKIAPAGAVKNDNGIYQVMEENITNAWAMKLEAGKGSR